MKTLAAPRWIQRCACGHLWLHHDIEEYDGDGSDTCCVEGCDQAGCPGRTRSAVQVAADFVWG